MGWGISRSNGTPGEDLLPEAQSTFDWIRLAQRVPVNIRLTDVPADVILRVGLTASVQVWPRAIPSARAESGFNRAGRVTDLKPDLQVIRKKDIRLSADSERVLVLRSRCL